MLTATRRAVAQLEASGGHDLLAGLDAVDDGDEVPASRARFDELLARDLARLAVGALDHVAGFVLLVLDDEDRIAEGRMDDGGCRNRYDRLLRRLDHRHVDEHPGAHPVGLGRETSAELDVARRGIDGRVDGGDTSGGGERRARVTPTTARESHRHSDRDEREVLLRQRKVDIRRLARLDDRDRCAGGQILAHVDQPNAELAGERCAHDLALDLRRKGVHVCGRRIESRVVGVDLRLRNASGREESARAPSVRRGEVFLGER